MKRSLWVIEIQFMDNSWHATFGVGITRDDARAELKHWRAISDPDDKLRLVRYVPEVK